MAIQLAQLRSQLADMHGLLHCYYMDLQQLLIWFPTSAVQHRCTVSCERWQPY